MKPRMLISLFLLAAGAASMQAQEGLEAPRISGYLSNSTLFASTHPDLTEETLWQNIVHQRLKMDWNLHPSVRMEAAVRNLFYTGNATILSYIEDYTRRDRKWLGLSWNLLNRKDMLYRLDIDRLSLQWTQGAWEAKIGRQRIDWGQTLVWNPLNIFNPYSFFQFNHPEFSGCDAIRTTCYHNATAYSELAASLNREGELTAALMHSRQANSVEYRLMTGLYNSEDAVIGGGLTAGHNRLVLRMEGACFYPLANREDTYEVIQLAAGADYVFANKLVLQGEVLYRSRSLDTDIGHLSFLYEDPQSAKELSIAKWSILAQAAYPVTPRLSARLSAAYFAGKQFGYAGLFLNYRISDSMEASLFAHFANNAAEEPVKIRAELACLQCKWNF